MVIASPPSKSAPAKGVKRSNKTAVDSLLSITREVYCRDVTLVQLSIKTTAQKKFKTGIGTMISLMLPYSISFLVSWTVLLLVYWGLGLPLGLQAGYTWPPAAR